MATTTMHSCAQETRVHKYSVPFEVTQREG